MECALNGEVTALVIVDTGAAADWVRVHTGDMEYAGGFSAGSAEEAAIHGLVTADEGSDAAARACEISLARIGIAGDGALEGNCGMVETIVWCLD